MRTVLSVEQKLETAEDHPLAVEGHRLRIHHLRKPRVLHHLRIDPIAVRARLVHDPGENHGLAGLELDAARERRPLSDLDIVGDIFPELESAVTAPNLAHRLGHATVGLEILLRDWHDESIDVSHVNAPFCCAQKSNWTCRLRVTGDRAAWAATGPAPPALIARRAFSGWQGHSRNPCRPFRPC